MDREEAIDIIKCLAWHTRPDEEKIEQAIKALSQQPCEDAISRKAAINAMSEETCGCCWDAKDILAHLPSVNPQASKEDIHREREQAYMRGYEDASRKYRTEPSEDAISRQAAIRLAEQGQVQGFEWQFKQLVVLPSVSTKKTGRWVNARVGKFFPSRDFKCSECGNILDFGGVNCGRGDANYCPNCGARMGEDGDKD